MKNRHIKIGSKLKTGRKRKLLFNPINVARNIKEYTSIEKWAEDMLEGLKGDLQAYRGLMRHGATQDNFTDYVDGLFVSSFIEWFIMNHFSE